MLQQNKLDLIVRSHEVKEGGYEVEHNGRWAQGPGGVQGPAADA